MEFEWPIITLDTPIEEIRHIHKDIWDYVIETGVKPNTPYKNDCVLCQYAYLKHNEFNARFYTPCVYRSACDFCPAIWCEEDFTTCCWMESSPYNEWCPIGDFAYDEDTCKNAAIKVRDIPFKEVNND